MKLILAKRNVKQSYIYIAQTVSSKRYRSLLKRSDCASIQRNRWDSCV